MKPDLKNVLLSFGLVGMTTIGASVVYARDNHAVTAEDVRFTKELSAQQAMQLRLLEAGEIKPAYRQDEVSEAVTENVTQTTVTTTDTAAKAAAEAALAEQIAAAKLQQQQQAQQKSRQSRAS